LSQRDSISITPALVLRPNNTESGVPSALHSNPPQRGGTQYGFVSPFQGDTSQGWSPPPTKVGGYRNRVLTGRFRYSRKRACSWYSGQTILLPSDAFLTECNSRNATCKRACSRYSGQTIVLPSDAFLTECNSRNATHGMQLASALAVGTPAKQYCYRAMHSSRNALAPCTGHWPLATSKLAT